MEKEISFVKEKRENREKRNNYMYCYYRFIVTLNAVTQGYNQESADEITSQLQELKEVVLLKIKEEEPQKQEQDILKQIMENWQERHEKLAYFIEHDELEKVETELQYVKANLQVQEYQASMQNIGKSIFIIHHIKEKFTLQIKNIF